jgi:hypothetical protein
MLINFMAGDASHRWNYIWLDLFRLYNILLKFGTNN